MSDRDLDPTSKVCLTCQQNGLRPSFNDEESNTGKFKVRLEIRTEPNNKKLFSYIGYGTSKKMAKKEASSAALRDNKFRERVPDHIRPGYRKSEGKKPNSRSKQVNRCYYGSDENHVSGNANPTGSRPDPLNQRTADERVRSNSNATVPNRPTSNPTVPSATIPNAATRAGPTSAIPNPVLGPTSAISSDSVNCIVNLYFRAKKLNRKPAIKFVCLHQNETVVKITVGEESKAAQGKDDLSAIEKAAKQFSLNIDGSKDEGASNFENNGIDYYNILNQIHLKTRKEFKSSCLLSNEEDRRSLFLCKCQLGEFISYGLDESIVFSQNSAAFEILIKLRNGLSDEIDELRNQRDEIEAKKKDKQDLVDLIDDEMARLASGNEFECKYENEFDTFSDPETDDKMYHDL